MSPRTASTTSPSRSDTSTPKSSISTTYLGWRLLAGSGRTPLTQSMTTGRGQIKRMFGVVSDRLR